MDKPKRNSERKIKPIHIEKLEAVVEQVETTRIVNEERLALIRMRGWA